MRRAGAKDPTNRRSGWSPERADPSHPSPDTSRTRRVVEALLVVIGALLAARVAIDVAPGVSSATTFLPVMAVGAIGMAVLAMTRLRLFVLALLVIRSTVDAFKLGSASSVGVDPAAVLSLMFLLRLVSGSCPPARRGCTAGRRSGGR